MSENRTPLPSPQRGPGAAAAATGRRAGSLVLVLLTAALLVAVNRWPGWSAVPFLTPATEQVLGLVNASLVLGLVVHLAGVLVDRPRLRAAGDLATSAMGIVVTSRLLQVFPFRFDDTGPDWSLLVRVLLVLGLVGSAIGVVVALVALVRGGRERVGSSV